MGERWDKVAQTAAKGSSDFLKGWGIYKGAAVDPVIGAIISSSGFILDAARYGIGLGKVTEDIGDYYSRVPVLGDYQEKAKDFFEERIYENLLEDYLEE